MSQEIKPFEDLKRDEFKDFPVLLEKMSKKSVESVQDYEYMGQMLLSIKQRMKKIGEYFDPIEKPLKESLKELDARRKFLEHFLNKGDEHGRSEMKTFYRKFKAETCRNLRESATRLLPVVVSDVGKVEYRTGVDVEISNQDEFFRQVLKGNIPYHLFSFSIKKAEMKKHLDQNPDLIAKWHKFLHVSESFSVVVK